jgi:hypothetical protein
MPNGSIFMFPPSVSYAAWGLRETARETLNPFQLRFKQDSKTDPTDSINIYDTGDNDWTENGTACCRLLVARQKKNST